MNRRNRFVLISKSTNEQKIEGIDSKVNRFNTYKFNTIAKNQSGHGGPPTTALNFHKMLHPTRHFSCICNWRAVVFPHTYRRHHDKCATGDFIRERILWLVYMYISVYYNFLLGNTVYEERVLKVSE